MARAPKLSAKQASPGGVPLGAVGGAQTAEIAPKAAATAERPSRRGFGLLGMLGAVMTLCAGVVGIWAWRS